MSQQPGLFDLSSHYESLSKFGDPLEKIKAVIGFEVFRNPIEAVLCFSEATRMEILIDGGHW